MDLIIVVEHKNIFLAINFYRFDVFCVFLLLVPPAISPRSMNFVSKPKMQNIKFKKKVSFKMDFLCDILC